MNNEKNKAKYHIPYICKRIHEMVKATVWYLIQYFGRSVTE